MVARKRTPARSMLIRAIAVVGTVAALSVGLSCAPPGQGGTSPCATRAAPARYRHVVWIWMENHNWPEVIGTPAAPYLTRLVATCGAATHQGVVGSPSLPNYIGATAGQTYGVADDSGPAAHPITGNNLFRQVRAANGSALSYEESMPSNCALGGSGLYAVKHNPAPYFVGPGDRAACARDNVPMGSLTSGAFISAVKNDALPTFAFVTPNQCNDTHDCPVAVGDAWLAKWVPKLVASKAYARGDTAVVISYDEDGPVPNVWIAPSVRPGARFSIATNHFSALRTIEEMLGLPYLGWAANARSYRAALHL